MHEHIEVIIPPTDDVERDVAKVMAPFDENGRDEEGEPNPRPWWDFYVIGGRWAGAKLKARFDPERIKAFEEELQRREVTVSGIQFGKPQLSPASQIASVDALWCEYFPEWPGSVCPLFAHYNDQYEHRLADGEVMRMADTPLNVSCSKVLIGARALPPDHELRAEFLLQDSVWNGCNHEDTRWNGTLDHALQLWWDRLTRMAERMREHAWPDDDWLAVTVDIHH